MSEARAKVGSLVCVGVGMTLGSHLTPIARSHIKMADVVFTCVSSGIVELWLREMHSDVRSLQPYYCEGTSRLTSYRAMVAAMLAEVRSAKRVCAAFYGHPGVFAWPGHTAIREARAEGYAAHMEPGVSAEDCLYADLGIDPGTHGCQHFEAGHLLLFRRRLDPAAYVVLWQVGVVGDRSLARFSTGPAYRHVLVDVLKRDYPENHEIIVYRAATLPLHPPRMERIALRDLPSTELTLEDTLVVPPAQPPVPDRETRARLDTMDAETAAPADR